VRARTPLACAHRQITVDLAGGVRQLDRTLIWHQQHLLHALREYKTCNTHRPHQGIANARPLQLLPKPITDLDRLAQLRIRRRDRLAGLLHEYANAA
jgi:putative transposase